MDVDVAGTKVLVTGASSGIGAALARRLAGDGAVVGLVARREDRLREVLDDCHRLGSGDSRLWVADLADLDLAERVAIEAWDAFGHLDVLVNNAAIPKRRRVTELTPAEVEGTMAVNFLAPARMTLAVLPRMLERDTGVIVNVASLGGRLGIVHEAAYCASKFALCGWRWRRTEPDHSVCVHDRQVVVHAHGLHGYFGMPPETEMSSPVTNDDASLAR